MTESMIEQIEDAIVDAVMDQELLNATIAKQMGKLWITGEAGIDLRAVVKAVLKAMREPTKTQLDAMEPWSRTTGHHEMVWKAGIDAALTWPAGSADRAGVPLAKD